MKPDGVLPSREAWARITQQVTWLENQPKSEIGYAGPWDGAPPPEVHHVRVTSLTQTDGRYPGKALLYDAVAKTWSDLDDIWVVSPPGGQALAVGDLINGPFYESRIQDFAAGLVVYVTDAGATANPIFDNLTVNFLDVKFDALVENNLTVLGQIIYNGALPIGGGLQYELVDKVCNDTVTIRDVSTAQSTISSNSLVSVKAGSITLPQSVTVTFEFQPLWSVNTPESGATYTVYLLIDGVQQTLVWDWVPQGATDISAGLLFRWEYSLSGDKDAPITHTWEFKVARRVGSTGSAAIAASRIKIYSDDLIREQLRTMVFPPGTTIGTARCVYNDTGCCPPNRPPPPPPPCCGPGQRIPGRAVAKVWMDDSLSAQGLGLSGYTTDMATAREIVFLWYDTFAEGLAAKGFDVTGTFSHNDGAGFWGRVQFDCRAKFVFYISCGDWGDGHGRVWHMQLALDFGSSANTPPAMYGGLPSFADTPQWWPIVDPLPPRGDTSNTAGYITRAFSCTTPLHGKFGFDFTFQYHTALIANTNCGFVASIGNIGDRIFTLFLDFDGGPGQPPIDDIRDLCCGQGRTIGTNNQPSPGSIPRILVGQVFILGKSGPISIPLFTGNVAFVWAPSSPFAETGGFGSPGWFVKIPLDCGGSVVLAMVCYGTVLNPDYILYCFGTILDDGTQGPPLGIRSNLATSTCDPFVQTFDATDLPPNVLPQPGDCASLNLTDVRIAATVAAG